jgi:hypothetical protein
MHLLGVSHEPVKGHMGNGIRKRFDDLLMDMLGSRSRKRPAWDKGEWGSQGKRGIGC